MTLWFVIRASGQPTSLPPFLHEFRAASGPPIVAEPVRIGERLRGYLARPQEEEALPALLLLDDGGLGRWMEQSAREMAGIGYVVLALDLDRKRDDEAVLADMTAALRWLRRRNEVAPERIGVAGWGWGAEKALTLAASMPVQACVACYGPLPTGRALLAGLQTTPVLIVSAGKDRALLPFRKALTAVGIHHELRLYETVSPGFMKPGTAEFSFAAAEEAWVEIYNFLARYVEDAPEHGPKFVAVEQARPGPRQVASIADIMRAVFAPTGLRGTLMRGLLTEPGSEQQWKTVRAQAALVAEAGLLLEQRRPQKGTAAHWQEQTGIVARTTQQLVEAADARDFSRASRALNELAERCAVCHEQHR